MSRLVHCDGPDCDETRDPNAGLDRRLGERPWLKVTDGPDDELDFHSNACLAAWSAGQTGSTTTVVDGR